MPAYASSAQPASGIARRQPPRRDKCTEAGALLFVGPYRADVGGRVRSIAGRKHIRPRRRRHMQRDGDADRDKCARDDRRNEVGARGFGAAGQRDVREAHRKREGRDVSDHRRALRKAEPIDQYGGSCDTREHPRKATRARGEHDDRNQFDHEIVLVEKWDRERQQRDRDAGDERRLIFHSRGQAHERDHASDPGHGGEKIRRDGARAERRRDRRNRVLDRDETFDGTVRREPMHVRDQAVDAPADRERGYCESECCDHDRDDRPPIRHANRQRECEIWLNGCDKRCDAAPPRVACEAHERNRDAGGTDERNLPEREVTHHRTRDRGARDGCNDIERPQPYVRERQRREYQRSERDDEARFPYDACDGERRAREQRPERQRDGRADERQYLIVRCVHFGDRAFDVPDIARPGIAAGIPGCSRGVIGFEVARERTRRRCGPEKRCCEDDADERRDEKRATSLQRRGPGD